MNTAAPAQAPANKANEWLTRLRANPRIPLMVASAAAVAIIVALVLWAKTPDYRVLYSNLSEKDGGAIVTQLTQMNVPYRFSDNGGAIMVPADNVHELRLKMAGLGLPKGGAVGFELLDQEKFGISQFSEQVNYQRALEGELSRTIETLGPVKSARVHLAMPKPSLFVREQKAPSASVTVNLEPGRALDEGQITAVVHMVSSAVAGLPPGNVTLVDQGGHLLTPSSTAGRDLNDAQLKYAADVEGRVQRRIEAILGPIVGNGNVQAQVTAQIDFASKEQTEEQRTQTANTNSAVPRNTQRDETTNYEVDRTIRHTKMNTGDVQRLSVAVVVNYRTLPDGKPLPLTSDQMKQIEDLTREAMGFSEPRGDTLNVVNSPFTETLETGGELPFWQQQSFIDQLMSAGRWLIVLIVAWLLWRKAVRPQLQRRAEETKAVQEVARQQKEMEDAVEVRLTRDEQTQQRRTTQRLSAEVMSQRIREMSDNDPRVVALVIRQWMSNEL
ncbi:flagellar basal-body MS-ring/collar protein FliF [Atlantibacter subterraneus]|uniref:flagellar basal-body MS-ring/collar protein FliF n=1 Tax=Atlantibacter subterraneus TaxID=255519 RepID=UPI002FDCCDBB